MSSASGTVAAQPWSDLRVCCVIVLAAGAGTRMKSTLPKVLHPIAGQPLLWHALSAAQPLSKQVVAVVGHERELVSSYLTAHHPQVRQAVQHQQLGTGHAVACALEGTSLTGTVLVSYGDVPLLRTATLAALATEHQRAGNAVTVLTAVLADPTGYGRMVRDEAGLLTGIVEHKDASAHQRTITEINSGVYAFDAEILTTALARLATAGPANAAGERYLTDVVAWARAGGHRIGSLLAGDAIETEGVNDRVQLAQLARVLNARLVQQAQLSGVSVLDPATTWIHADVTVGQDTVLLPGTSLEAGSQIGAGCVIGPDTTLSNCHVQDGASVLRSHCVGARIGAGASVGPYSYLRPGTELDRAAKIGAFVETKNSTFGVAAKVPHLSYVGDTQVGAGANIGAGTITANYDGQLKSNTVIGENAFIGTDSTLIAPVRIGAGAYVAAGSTITDDVDPGDLAIARGRQLAVKGWVLRRREGTDSARSAAAAGATAAHASTDPDVTAPPVRKVLHVSERDLPA